MNDKRGGNEMQQYQFERIYKQMEKDCLQPEKAQSGGAGIDCGTLIRGKGQEK